MELQRRFISATQMLPDRALERGKRKKNISCCFNGITERGFLIKNKGWG